MCADNNNKQITRSSEKTNETEDSIVKAACNNLLKRVTTTASLDDIQKLVKTESKAELKEIREGKGFINMNMSMRITESSGLSANGATTIIENNLSGLKCLDSSSQDGITTIKQNLYTFMKDEALNHKDHFFNLRFANPSGTVTFVAIQLTRTKKSLLDEYGLVGPRWDWRFGKVEGQFTPAPDYRIESHSKSNFFSSKQTISISPLQTTLDQQKIAALIETFPAARFAFFEGQKKLGDHQPETIEY